jgi:divalent metal cation (Fe/Co/Zn/Cd) transporter
MERPAVTPDRRRWTRIATRLVLATLAYNVIEATVAIVAGWKAGSIALVGFGLDAVIEFMAASIMLWRLLVESRGGSHEEVERTERRVHRFVGVTFLLLAAYVTAQSGWILWRQEAPGESIVGIALAVVSLVVMPVIAWGKLRAADRLRSGALRAEAKETLACSFLSVALFLGLGLNAALGWWWADPAAALVMVPWLVREGLEGVRGETCEDGDDGKP